MTLKFTFLDKSREWAVSGPADEVKLGMVEVERGNGEVKTERIIKVTREYLDKDGNRRRLGFIAPLPWMAPKR